MKTAPALALLLLMAAPGPLRGESFESWSAKALRAQKNEDDAAAIEAFGSALRLWKKSDGKGAKARILAARAAVYEKTEDFDKAAEDLAAAIALEPKNASHYDRRGRVYLRQSKPAEAIDDFYKATKLNILYKEAYFDRAQAYEMQGDLKFAREDYRTACKLGLKKACGGGHASEKPGRKPAAAKAEPKAAAPEASTKTVAVVTVSTAAAVKSEEPAAPRVDFQACLAALDACLEEGASFSACVDNAKTCEGAPEKGCCPQACVNQFDRLVETMGRSEASAFREVFGPKSSCAAP